MKRLFIITLILSVFLSFNAFGAKRLQSKAKGGKKPPAKVQVEVTKAEFDALVNRVTRLEAQMNAIRGGLATVTAKVNDQAIGQQAYEREVAQFLSAWESLGNSLESAEGQASLPALRRQVLDLMIDDVLVQQAAAEADIGVSGQEIQTRMAEEVFQGGGPEPFQAWLEETGQTWQEFRRDVCQGLLQEAILDHITAGPGAAGDPPPDPDAPQARAFQQWLTQRREAAGIELYVDASW